MVAPIYTALGLMSGTSLDGIDGAICITDGRRILGFGESHYRPYSNAERTVLQSVIGKWPGDSGLKAAKDLIHNAHLELVEKFSNFDLISFHGQTLNHDPDQGRTFQLGDGAALAKASGKTVVWDFRSQDMAAGGQGAPLAPFFHFALIKALGLRNRVAVLNLGGVGNVTLIDPRHPSPETDNALLAFDTGPANAPINDLMQSRGAGVFDKDGAIAQAGQADLDILQRLMQDPYFTKPAPKSLDRDQFNWLLDAVADLPLNDAAASLSAAVVSAVYGAQMWFHAEPKRWLIAGGGRHNMAIMNGLRTALDAQVDPIEVLGFDGDMIEAQAFAYLGARVMADLPTSATSTTGCGAPVCGGRISAP